MRQKKNVNTLTGDYFSSDKFLHYFVASAVDHLEPSVHEGPGDRVLPHVAPATMHLKTLCRYSVL